MKKCILAVACALVVILANMVLAENFVPKDIKLKRATYRKVTVSWQPPDSLTQIANYKVYRDGSEIATVNALEYTDTNVQPGMMYIYQVKAVTVGGESSDLTGELQIHTLTSAQFENSSVVETAVDSMHDASSDLGAVALMSAVKSGLEAVLGTAISFSVIDEEVITELVVEELTFITAVTPALTDAEEIGARAELQQLLENDFSGNTFDHLYINAKLTQIGEMHWARGHVAAAKLFYEFSLNYLGDDETTVSNSLCRLAWFARSGLNSDSSAAEISAKLGMTKDYHMRYFEFFPETEPSVLTLQNLHVPLFYYFLYFPKMLEYDNYDVTFWRNAQEMVERLAGLDADDAKSQSWKEIIPAWELLQLQVRFADENGNPRSGVLKIRNVSAENGKEYLFPRNILPDERLFTLANGTAMVPVYAGHLYEGCVELDVDGGDKLIYELPSFDFGKRQNFTYDYRTGSATAAAGAQSRVDIVVPETKNYPYNLRVDRGVDVFDLSWSWNTAGGFALAGFKVFRGDTEVASTTTNSARIALDNAQGEYTYTVVAYDHDGNPSVSSRSITVYPGDQSRYADFFAWMESYFGGQEMYSYLDPDGDGVDNYHEFLNGTDPTKAPCPTPFAGPRGFNELTFEWESVSDAEGVEYQISRDGQIIATSHSSWFTDVNLIPGLAYTYKVRLVSPVALATDWSNPNTFRTQRAHTYPEADKVQQVVDAFVKLDVLDYTGANLISAVKSGMEALTGTTIAFSVVNQDLLEQLVSQELAFLNEVSPSMTLAEKLAARNELDQLMQKEWAGNSFEEVYINGKLADLAETHWRAYQINPANTANLVAAEELYNVSLYFLKDHEITVGNALTRMGFMRVQSIPEDAANADIKAALDASRDTQFRIYDYFPNLPLRSSGTPHRKVIHDYWRYFPRLLHYDNYDRNVFDNTMQIATSLASRDFTNGAAQRLRRQIAAWELTSLTVTWAGTDGRLEIRNVSGSLPESPWRRTSFPEESREFRLNGADISIPIYVGHSYEISLYTAAAGGPEWKHTFEPVVFGKNMKVTADAFGGVTRRNLAGNAGRSELEIPYYPVSFPYNLRAEKHPDTFDLSWEYAVPENAAVAHFNVYRGDVPVTSVPGTTALGIPREVYADGVYAYSVSAADAAGFESPRSPVLLMVPDFSDEELKYFEWKQKYFGNTPTLADDDPDGDGLTNWQEFQLGSNPLVAPGEPVVDGKIPGVKVSYFGDVMNLLPDFSKMAPYAEEIRADFCFDNTSGEVLNSHLTDNVGMVVEGYFETALSGKYNLFISSDDSCRWYIDDALVASNELTGSQQEYLKSIMLTGGIHSFRVEYVELTHNARLQLAWSGPDFSRRSFEASELWYCSEITPEFREYLMHQKDSDSDGVTDALEFLYGTDRFNPDSDGDGLSDGEEIYTWGTDPNQKDTNQNGISDYDEVNTFGGDIKLDSLTFRPVTTIAGKEFKETRGRWKTLNDSVMLLERRGSATYEFALEAEGILRLDIACREAPFAGLCSELDIFIDGLLIKSVCPDLNVDTAVVLPVYTPSLQPGTHKIKIFRDNYRSIEPLMIDSITVTQVHSQFDGRRKQSAKNNKHRSDSHSGKWAAVVEELLRQRNSCSDIRESFISPYCLTGTALYPALVQVNGESVNIMGAQEWYRDVPLNQDASETVTISFENDALQMKRELKWNAFNLLDHDGEHIRLRRNDSLLLLMGNASCQGNWKITGAGGVRLEGEAGIAHPLLFDTPGTFRLSGECRNADGNSIEAAITVEVLQYDFARADTACWVGRGRDWAIPMLPSGTSLNFDSRLLAAEQTVEAGKLWIRAFADDNQVRYANARIGEDGPVLAVQTITGMGIYSSNFTYVRELQEYADGTKLYEMLIVVSEPRPDVELRLNIFVSGVLFEDGTLSKTIQSNELDELGMIRVNFLYAAGTQTSVCHNLMAYQSGEYIGTRSK